MWYGNNNNDTNNDPWSISVLVYVFHLTPVDVLYLYSIYVNHYQ